MLSEKRIRAIVKDELKEQIRKQTIRMRVLLPATEWQKGSGIQPVTATTVNRKK